MAELENGFVASAGESVAASGSVAFADSDGTPSEQTKRRKAIEALGFDPEAVKKLPLGELLKKVGPGFILAGIQLGPGSLLTSAMLGAEYGYALMWILLPVIFMGTTFIMVCYRLSMLTGMPTVHAIRHYYGAGAAGFVGVVAFLACMCFNVGNVSGIGAGMQLLTGLDWRIGALVVMAFVFLCYFMRGVYAKLERCVSVALALMAIAFLVVLFMSGGIDTARFATGMVAWQFPEGSIPTVLAFLGSSATVLAGMYGTYLGCEKDWKKQDLFNGVMAVDAAAQVFGTVVISGLIIAVGAVVLNPTGATINAPADLAAMLVPTLGAAAPIVMGVALLAAAFAAIMGNTGRCVVFLMAGLDKSTSLEGHNVKVAAGVVMALAIVVCFIFGGSPVQLLYFSNVATSVATPVAGFFITRMIWREDIACGIRGHKALRVCMTISYVVYVCLMAFALARAIPNFVGSLV